MQTIHRLKHRSSAYNYRVWFRFMVFNVTFNTISAISQRSVLLVEEIRVLGENHRTVASHWQTLSHNVVSITPRHERVRTHKFSIWLIGLN
jgi:hypothetical protein